MSHAMQAAGPWLGINLKYPSKDAGITGALVGDVAVNSPADAAGIKIGDVITNLNGKDVKSADDLTSAASTLEKGKPYKITFRRGSESLTVDITPQEKAATISVKRKLADINVLKYAVIDPTSHVITLIGKYDPVYKTGSIPYYDLLNDAMESPYPWFSLEPTDETKNGVKKVHSAISEDVARMYSDSSYCSTWTMNLLNMILNDPTLSSDRAEFIKKGAEAFNISEPEMLMILQNSAAGTTSDELIPVLGKVLLGMGYTQVGQSLLTHNNDSQQAFQLLGISTESSDIISKFQSGEMSREEASLKLAVLLESAILRGLNIPESEYEPKANAVLNGRMDVSEYLKYTEQKVTDIVVDGVGLKMFNGLTLSHKLLTRLYNVPTPQMDLVFNGVPAGSLLGDVLFRADYALKSVCTNPEVKNSIPGFQTEMDYMYDSSTKTGIRIPGDAGAEVGHRLIPGEVKMRVSPSGDVVTFDEANVKIIGWLIGTTGKKCTTEVAGFMKSSAEGYSDYLTQNYDQLAKVFPELHRIREAEKLIAFARWAKKNGYSIVVDRATGIKMAQSPTAVGFWQAVFTADQKEFSLTIITEGGASFGQSEGEEWVKPNVDREVTSDVSKQLVMSAVMAKQAALDAIDGNIEAARDMADKSALAMTGDIDFTKLPTLEDLPLPSDQPAQSVVLSNEAVSAVDENLRKIEDAKITMAKADELQNVSPKEAAVFREEAEAQTRQANANLQGIRDAMDSIKNDPIHVGDVAIAIHNLGGKVTPASIVASNPSNTSGTAAQTTVNGQDIAVKPAGDGGITPELRKKYLAQLESLQSQLEATKAQLQKLNKSIQQDQKQFDDWEKVAQDGMDKCSNFLYGLLMDATAGQLSDRYEEMHKLAEKLPNHPEDLITRLNHIKNWFKAMKYTQTLKDVSDVAARDGETLQELLEEVRDDLNIIVGITPLDKTLPGALWKYGSNVADMAYSYTEFSAAYDRINQLDKNSDDYLKAVKALSERMKKVVDQIKDLKSKLGIQ
ncbi:MAG: PDZ domain-containing protein [Armatimonadota bacterium]